jgi:chloramphenicol-sensitive protein RarD
MLQYMGPTIQFVLAVLVLGETLTPLRLVSFGMIWLAVGIYTADSILRRRR